MGGPDATGATGSLRARFDSQVLSAPGRTRALWAGIAVVGLLAGLDTLFLHLSTDPLADVHAYYDAGSRLNVGAPLYPANADPNAPGFFRYPPLLAIVFRPLALLPFPIAATLWEALVVALFILSVRRLGVRLPSTWIGLSLLAFPTAWALAIGQAQVPVTYLLVVGTPAAVALATNLKMLPLLVAVFWLGRRDGRSLARLAAWLLALAALQLALEPSASVAFLGTLNLSQVGDVRNLSPYAISPILWVVFAACGAALALLLSRTRLGWAAAVALTVLTAPRLLAYSFATLLAGLSGRPGWMSSVESVPTAAEGLVGGAPLRLPRMQPASLTIVLPAYNEEARLGSALDELFGYLERHGERGRDGAPGAAALPADIRVLVVDDGSTDGTAALVRARPEAVTSGGSANPALALISLPHGGKGAAVRAGMLAADSDLVVFADADMAAPPDQIPLLVAALADQDLALGSRIQPDGSDMRASQPAYRRLLGRAFHLLASVWAVGPVQDTQCGFKGFAREAAHDLFSRQAITSIVFDVELIYLARRRGYRIAIVPIRWADRRGSRMHPGPRLALRVAWDLLRTPLLHRRVPRRPA